MRTTIPKITNKELAKLRKRIQPLIRVHLSSKEEVAMSNEERLFYIKPIDPRHRTFLPGLVGRFVCPSKEATGLRKFREITTIHPMEPYLNRFVPTIAEVIAQIPEHYRNKVVAFETKMDDLSGGPLGLSALTMFL